MNPRILVVDDSPTIRKVVGSILTSRDYEPLLAKDGAAGLKILGEQAVDLVLLDFLMPELNGYQFCRALRGIHELRELPVVMMSAKGDKIRGAFVRQTGAIDAITKPFDARGLVAVIEGALKKKQEGRAPPVPEASAMPEEEPRADSLLPPLPDESAELAPVHTPEAFRQELARLLIPAFETLPGVSRASTSALDTAIRQAVTPAALSRLGALFEQAPGQTDLSEVLAGDLAVISIAEVLQMLELQQQSGNLTVFTGKSSVSLYIVDGHIAFASQQGLRDEFLIGRKLCQMGAVTREQLLRTLERQRGTGRLIGELLVARTFAQPEQIRQALTQQSSELLYEVVRWQKGRFKFMSGETCPAAEQAALRLAPGALMMEAFRRVDEWRLIEDSVDFNEVLIRDQVALERMDQERQLKPQELVVLAMIDGKRTVREIVDRVGGSSFELCKILYQFLNSRLVRSRKAA